MGKVSWSILQIIFLLACLLSIKACVDTVQPKGDEENTFTFEETPVETIPVVDTESREAWQKPGMILQKMGDLSNRVVADVGAGTGYFAFRLLSRSEKVIAIEIDQSLIELMDGLASTLSDESKKRFETRLATPDHPKLKQGEVDDILIVNVVGYLDNLIDYFQKCRMSLTQKGKIHIIDYKVKRLPIEAPPYSERIYIHLIEEALEQAGFTNIITDDTSLEYQYIVQAENRVVQ